VDEETRYRLCGEEDEEDVVLVLRPMRRFGAPPIARLKRLLKAAKRCYGFKVVECRNRTFDQRKGNEKCA